LQSIPSCLEPLACREKLCCNPSAPRRYDDLHKDLRILNQDTRDAYRWLP
jgi:hypothetical protein